MNIPALHISLMTDWLNIIPHPETVGIPLLGSHLFQIFAVVECDQLWFARNKAYHDDLVSNALVISTTINKISKEHHFAWKNKSALPLAVWSKPNPPFYKINYDTAIRASFSV
jgi:hypothetical protein